METIELNDLVRMAKSGDQESAVEILRRFAPLKIKLIKNYFGYGTDWDDYLSEGDRIIMESIRDYDLGRNVPFESYLKIKLRYLYQNIRARKKELIYLDQEIGDGITMTDILESDDPPIDEPIIGIAERDEVREALNSLTEKQKTIIELHFYQEKSIRQCSEIMGISYQSAVELKGRAIKSLTDIIKNLQKVL
ncbi:MAG: sigma-70 family RNA polymerase sigma factor [Thermoanaerobacteraceae bacterium]|nr:sigma-70 family RNA polymerase sigma factor [Thermoanaerobacteraceae bacterium]